MTSKDNQTTIWDTFLEMLSEDVIEDRYEYILEDYINCYGLNRAQAGYLMELVQAHKIMEPISTIPYKVICQYWEDTAGNGYDGWELAEVDPRVIVYLTQADMIRYNKNQ